MSETKVILFISTGYKWIWSKSVRCIIFIVVLNNTSKSLSTELTILNSFNWASGCYIKGWFLF